MPEYLKREQRASLAGKQPTDADFVKVVSWPEVFAWVDAMHNRYTSARIGAVNVYGVPRGGAIVAGLLEARYPTTFMLTGAPSLAELVVDDIIDSGETRKRLKLHTPAPFEAVIDKLELNDPNTWYRFPWEDEQVSTDLATNVTRLLQGLGEDVSRDGLKDTPERVARWLTEFCKPDGDPATLLGRRFQAAYDEMVAVTGIEFWSLCEHHMLPFHGRAHVAYLPGEGREVVGLSKLPRLVHHLASGLRIQEELTQAIANTISAHLKPKGVAVVLEAEHTCMAMRGAKARGTMTTSCLLGAFRDPTVRAEFFALVRGGGS